MSPFFVLVMVFFPQSFDLCFFPLRFCFCIFVLFFVGFLVVIRFIGIWFFVMLLATEGRKNGDHFRFFGMGRIISGIDI
jgi:hypothetical protein